MRKFIRSLPASVGWLVVLSVTLCISGYSLYYVARHLGVPQIFAAGFSTAYDGGALLAAYKSLQYAQEGRSGAAPRFVVIAFVGLSAWLNSLHAILGHESSLAIPMWAGLPISAAIVFELHTSQARAKALARLGKKYPRPMPSWGAATWLLFLPSTLDLARDLLRERRDALGQANKLFFAEDHVPKAARVALDAQERPRNGRGTNERLRNERTGQERPNERTGSDRGTAERTVVQFHGRAAHAPDKGCREWARAKGYPVGVRGGIPAWIKEEYAQERAEEGTNEPEEGNERYV